MKETVDDLLSEYEDEDFPKPLGKWHAEDDADPRWLRETLRRAERHRLIKIDRLDAKNWRWAFTLEATEARKMKEAA